MKVFIFMKIKFKRTVKFKNRNKIKKNNKLEFKFKANLWNFFFWRVTVTYKPVKAGGVFFGWVFQKKFRHSPWP